MRPTDRRLAIAGVGESALGRKVDRALDALLVDASRRAIADAGLGPADIDGIITHIKQPPLDEIALGAGMTRRSYSAINAYVPGAGPVAALVEAKNAIAAGLATTVLVVYGTRTSAPGGPYAYHAADPLKADLEMPMGYYGQPLYFAAMMQRYRHEYGLEAAQLGSLAVAQREWASRTPGAQRPQRITMDDYLKSPVIAEPIRNLDCCLISDGAVAYVVTTLERARDLPHPRPRPRRVPARRLRRPPPRECRTVPARSTVTARLNGYPLISSGTASPRSGTTSRPRHGSNFGNGFAN